MQAVRTIVSLAAVGVLCWVPLVRAEERCYSGGKVDARYNTNDNKRGTACYRQVAKVRKLEFDPRFDCSKAIREAWQREFDIAAKMGCIL